MKILWIGDGGVPTGFATVTHALCHEFVKAGHEVVVLGVSYNGDPHGLPWKMYPAAADGANMYGVERIPKIVAREKPDVICLLNDSWVLAAYLAQLQELLPKLPPMIAYIPVDAENQWAARKLNALKHVITYTVFGAQEIRRGGYAGPVSIAPHGIDGTQWYPVADARERLKGFPVEFRDKFIVGNINRNQPRKRLDITMMAFAEFWKRYGHPLDVVFLFHCAIQDVGWELVDLANYNGLSTSNLMFTGVKSIANYDQMASPERLRLIYNILDLQVSSSLGEGWGLTNMEGMACGVKQLLPYHSAFAEWAAPYAEFYEANMREVHTQGINTVSRVPSIEKLSSGIGREYLKWKRGNYRAGQDIIAQRVANAFPWSTSAETFLRVFREVTQ